MTKQCKQNKCAGWTVCQLTRTEINLLYFLGQNHTGGCHLKIQWLEMHFKIYPAGAFGRTLLRSVSGDPDCRNVLHWTGNGKRFSDATKKEKVWMGCHIFTVTFRRQKAKQTWERWDGWSRNWTEIWLYTASKWESNSIYGSSISKLWHGTRQSGIGWINILNILLKPSIFKNEQVLTVLFEQDVLFCPWPELIKQVLYDWPL